MRAYTFVHVFTMPAGQKETSFRLAMTVEIGAPSKAAPEGVSMLLHGDPVTESRFLDLAFTDFAAERIQWVVESARLLNEIGALSAEQLNVLHNCKLPTRWSGRPLNPNGAKKAY